jgi:hypothetical protein
MKSQHIKRSNQLNTQSNHMKNIKISNEISIVINGYERDHPVEMYDANWLNSSVKCDIPDGIIVNAPLELSTFDLSSLRELLTQLMHGAPDEITFTSISSLIAISLKKTGVLNYALCFDVQFAGACNTLVSVVQSINVEQIDKTITDIEATLALYPVRLLV